MSMSYSSYLGPYVRCKTHKVVSKQQKKRCSNKKCPEFKHFDSFSKAKFCGVCGSPIETFEIDVSVPNIQSDDVRLNLLNEALCEPAGDSFYFWMEKNDVHIWLANRLVATAKGRQRYIIDSEEISLTPVSPESLQGEIKDFQSFYEKELVILRQEYGEENVEIQWGLIHDIS